MVWGGGSGLEHVVEKHFCAGTSSFLIDRFDFLPHVLALGKLITALSNICD
ncbi:hypothetical protein ACLOJK_031238 [Asimina triloba]